MYWWTVHSSVHYLICVPLDHFVHFAWGVLCLSLQGARDDPGFLVGWYFCLFPILFFQFSFPNLFIGSFWGVHSVWMISNCMHCSLWVSFRRRRSSKCRPRFWHIQPLPWSPPYSCLSSMPYLFSISQLIILSSWWLEVIIVFFLMYSIYWFFTVLWSSSNLARPLGIAGI